MDALYSKLYDKYTKLKAKKASEIDVFNLDQENKFKNYVSVAEELIGYLNSERERLKTETDELKQEVATIRSEKYELQDKYEKMLIEENQKIIQLSNEIEVLQRKASTKDDMFAVTQVSGSPPSSAGATKKRRNSRNIMQEKHREHENTSLDEPENDLDKENNTSGAIYNGNQGHHCNENFQHQSRCCRRKLAGSVYAASDPSLTTCMFQELVESLVNLKFSVETQRDDNIQITALHESSGYSFTLGWVKNVFKAAEGGKGEEDDELLVYRLSSLGTLERVAPEWMRDVMLFSKPMCPTFFKRVLAVV